MLDLEVFVSCKSSLTPKRGMVGKLFFRLDLKNFVYSKLNWLSAWIKHFKKHVMYINLLILYFSLIYRGSQLTNHENFKIESIHLQETNNCIGLIPSNAVASFVQIRKHSKNIENHLNPVMLVFIG